MPLAMVNMFLEMAEAFQVLFTIPQGTGIGGGAIQNGNFIEGFSHPEMGHMLVNDTIKTTFLGHVHSTETV